MSFKDGGKAFVVLVNLNLQKPLLSLQPSMKDMTRNMFKVAFTFEAAR